MVEPERVILPGDSLNRVINDSQLVLVTDSLLQTEPAAELNKKEAQDKLLPMW